MLHPLQRKIDALRGRLRLAGAMRGTCLVAAALLAAVVALGTADYLLRIQDRGVRIIFSLSALGILGWTSYQFLGKVVFARIGEVDLAGAVERAFPVLRNRLLSAVQFLSLADDDPTAGSPALRRAVVESVAADARTLDFSTVVDLGDVKRAVALLTAACLLAGAALAASPTIARTAFFRLVNPLGDDSWPRTTHLELRRPVERIVRGQSFQVEAVDARGAPLPLDMRVLYRFENADGSAVEETEPMQLGAAAAVARRDDVRQSFFFRVEGGDDRAMPWHGVEAVDPPAVESLSIRLTPPSYAGLPPANAERLIRALRGTRARMSGRFNRPMAAAALRLGDGAKIPAAIGADGLSFSIGGDGVPLVVDRSGQYWFELTDRDGLRGESERWEIQAVADAPTTVVVERPAADLFVTPDATVPIRVAAGDDLAVARIELAYRPDEMEPERRLTIYTGPTNATSFEGGARKVNYRWNLAPLELRPGMKAAFSAVAADYSGQASKSDPRRLIVVSPEELLARLADRVKLISAELGRALEMQRGCRDRVEKLRSRFADSRPLERSELDRLQAVEQVQREVELLFSAGGEGLPRHVRALLADMTNNRVVNPLLRDRMEALLDELGRLDRQPLPAIGRELAAAAKSARLALEGQGGQSRAAESLAAAVINQNAVIAALEKWIERLARSDASGGFLLRLGVLLLDQQNAARRTAEIGRRTIARRLGDLSSDEAADLAAAAAAQLELAQRTDRLLQEIAQSLDQPRRQEPSAVDSATAVLDGARRRAVAAAMLAAADRIKLNQVGQAAAVQKRIVRDLREILGLDENDKRTDETAGESIGESEDDRRETPTESRAENERPGTRPGTAPERTSAERKAEIERARARMTRLWGELPPRVRENMLQSAGEDFPPKYERMIEDYFRRLAEEKGREERGGKND